MIVRFLFWVSIMVLVACPLQSLKDLLSFIGQDVYSVLSIVTGVIRLYIALI